MQSVRKVGSRWQMRFYSSKRRPKEVSHTVSADAFTKKQAEKLMRELTYKWESGEWDPWTDPMPGERGDGILLGDALQRYLDEKKRLGRRGARGGWTTKTLKGNEGILDAFARRVGKQVPVGRITADHLDEYIYQPQLAAATREGYRAKLRAFLNWMKREGYLDTLPDLPPPVQKQTRLPVYATEKEMLKICAAHPDILKKQYTESRHAARQRAERPPQDGCVFRSRGRPGQTQCLAYPQRIRGCGERISKKRVRRQHLGVSPVIVRSPHELRADCGEIVLLG